MLIRAFLISLLLHFLLIGLDRPMAWSFLTRGAAPLALSASFSLPKPGLHDSGADGAAPTGADPRLVTNSKSEVGNNSGFEQFSGLTAGAPPRRKLRSDKVAEVDPRAPDSPIEPKPEVDVVSEEAARLYRLNLAREARHFRRYPELARASGWEGVVIVAIATPSIGAAPGVSLARSSGHRVLDDQAVEMMAQAVGRALIPPDMLGRRFRIDVPLEYRLAD